MSAVILAVLLCLSAPVGAREPLPAAGSIEVAFTPGDDAENAIVNALNLARQAIYVQAYLFTSHVLARALTDARQRGILVEVLADREMVMKGENSQIPKLAKAGIAVWLENRYANAHNKIILIDPLESSSAVITGSYNFTYSAQARNAENLLILRGNLPLAHAYFDNWQRHRRDAIPYQPPSDE